MTSHPPHVGLEATAMWPEIQAALSTSSSKQVADRFGVPLSELRAALRRTQPAARVRLVRPEPLEPTTSQSAAPAAATSSDSPTEHRMSTEEVTKKKRSRSARRGKSAKAASKPHPVDAFRDKLGIMPDPDIAQLAGVSMWVVRGYRIRAGIKPYDRWESTRAEREADPSRRRRPRAPKTQEVLATKVAETHSRPSNAFRGAWAWRVTTSTGEGFVVGATLVEAAAALDRAGIKDVARIERAERVLA